MAAKKRRFAVIARNERIRDQGVDGGRGKRSFRGKTQMVIDDPAEAREIEARYGKKGSHSVNVIEDERLGWHEDHDRQTDGKNVTVHHYTFGTSQKFSDAWAAFERRRKRRLKHGKDARKFTGSLQGKKAKSKKDRSAKEG